ncbi:hypothetical protein D018_4045B, partial [Vibrio parahaemolyticus VP2007-007]
RALVCTWSGPVVCRLFGTVCGRALVVDTSLPSFTSHNIGPMRPAVKMPLPRWFEDAIDIGAKEVNAMAPAAIPVPFRNP